MHWETVMRTFDVGRAQLIRSRLEAAGFVVYVAHEASALATEGYALATGGVLVQVPADAAADARQLLEADNEASGSTDEERS